MDSEAGAAGDDVLDHVAAHRAVHEQPVDRRAVVQHLHHMVDEVGLDSIALAEDDEPAVGDVPDLVLGEKQVRPARENPA